MLAVVSQKGGVGKTTTAVNLAAAFARRGMRTLLVDVDPQGSVRYGIGVHHSSTLGLSDVLLGQRTLREIILPTALPWLNVVLAGSVSDAVSHAAYQQRIAESSQLRELFDVARATYDIVVVDTPPGLGAIVRRVLEVSQRVLIPVQCEPLALQTTPQILRGIQDIIYVNEELTLDGLLLTMYDETNPASARVREYMREHVPANMMFEIAVPRSAAAVDAFAAGQPLVLRDPNDEAARAYSALADVLAERLA